MITPSSLYHCEVVHVRTKPILHKLRMNVFYLWLDVEKLGEMNLRLFSYNRLNMFNVIDKKWNKQDNAPLAKHIRTLAENTVGIGSVNKIFMLCMPALFGRVFNPITSYYCFGAQDKLLCLVFDVNNTFGHSHSYVVRADELNDDTKKRLHVSPFNVVEGYYHFKAPAPEEKLHLAVQLFTQDSLTLNTWINGQQKPLTDWNLLKAFLRMPLLPLQVLFGIHWEAFKLWRKGLKINATPPHPEQSFSNLYEGPAR